MQWHCACICPTMGKGSATHAGTTHCTWHPPQLVHGYLSVRVQMGSACLSHRLIEGGSGTTGFSTSVETKPP
eukprot:7015264-Prorocentrum_lima.AAC.1